MPSFLRRMCPSVESMVILVVFAMVSVGVWGNGLVRDDLLFFNDHDTDISPPGLLELTQRTYFHELGEQDIFYYRPLSRAVYRLENLVFAGNPAGYHALAVLLHLALLLALNCVLKPWIPSASARLLGLLWVGLHPATHSLWVYMTGVVDTLPLLLMMLAILTARRRGIMAVALSLILALVGTLSKESGILTFPVVIFLLWQDGRGREMGGFLAGAVVLAGGYLALRSSVAATPELGSLASWGPLMLALFRESFWTPLLALVRPDLCHQENHVLATFPHDGIFLALSLLFWVGGATLAWKRRWKAALPLFVLFLMFWLLSIPNMSFSIELSSPGNEVHELYLPDHLLVVPLLCLVLPLAKALSDHRVGLGCLALVTLATLGVSAMKVGEWKDEMTLFKSIVARDPPVSRPYRVLALRQMEAGQLGEATETINVALLRGFKNSELYQLAAVAAQRSGDLSTRDHMLKEGARQGIVESMLELPVILSGPGGREKAQSYLKAKQRLFPRDEWFKRQEEVLK